MTTPFLDTARRVIRTEAQALEQLADSLDDRFRQAIDLLVATRGRVIVTGIGKSGHIAKKIAATLARPRSSSTLPRQATAIWG
jgi:arabinose-5-phosphate isomerase